MEGWFDGACEPFNPGGVTTWAYVLRDGDRLLAADEGLVEGPPESRTSNVAEYWGLARLLHRILAEGWQDQPWTLHGDSRLIVKQASGEWRANRPHLAALRDHVQSLLRQIPGARLVQVPREANAEADAGTHRAYEAALDADPALRKLAAPHLASEGAAAPLRGRRHPDVPLHGARRVPPPPGEGSAQAGGGQGGGQAAAAGCRVMGAGKGRWRVGLVWEAADFPYDGGTCRIFALPLVAVAAPRGRIVAGVGGRRFRRFPLRWGNLPNLWLAPGGRHSSALVGRGRCGGPQISQIFPQRGNLRNLRLPMLAAPRLVQVPQRFPTTGKSAKSAAPP